MSPTVSNVLANGGTPSSGSNVTASWTPNTANQYLLSINAYVSTGSVAPAISSVTGNGVTWTLIDSVLPDAAGTDRTAVFLYAASGTGGSTGAITIAWSTAPTRTSWVLDEIVSANSGLGSGTLPQAAVSGTSSAANPSATLGSSLQPGSITYAVAGFESSTGSLSAGSGYTALGMVNTQSLAWILSEWDSAGSTSASASNTVTSNRHGIILIEIANSSSGVSGTAVVTLKKMTVAISGALKDSGAAVGTLKKMTVAASGIAKDSSTGAVRLKKMTVAVTGAVFDKGTSAAVLRKMTVSGTATAPVGGTVAVKIRKMTTFDSGKAKVSGAISVDLRKMTTSGFGFAPVFGTISVTMLKMEVRASDHVPEASPLFLFSLF